MKNKLITGIIGSGTSWIAVKEKKFKKTLVINNLKTERHAGTDKKLHQR